MKFARIVFCVAGLYGLIVLLPMYFMEARIGIDSPPAITHREYFYGFIGVALAWQVMFFIIARDPVRYRWAMLAGILEKLGFGAAAVTLYAQGQLAAPTFAGGVIDLILATLFACAFAATPKEKQA